MIDYSLYSKQMVLPGFGLVQQQRLLQAKVLVIGAGGLGCPVMQYLSAMGVGTLGIVDDDVVEKSNLHRQILFGVNDMGSLKVDVVKKVLNERNPSLQIDTYPFRLNNLNALHIIASYDVVVDATDNFETRYLLNDVCVLLDKPFVYAAIFAHEAQLSVFNYGPVNERTTYRDAFPNPPQAGEVPSCADAGVLGVYPGIIGCMQALEVVKLLSGCGEVLQNKILIYHFLTHQSYIIQLTRNALIQYPSREQLLAADYAVTCVF